MAVSQSLVLGLDLGTSYLKAGLFDLQGNLRGLGRERVETRPGKFTHEVPSEAFLEILRKALSTAQAEASATPDMLAAVSYASQANSFILLDSALQPLTPLILWPSLPPPDANLERVRSVWNEPAFAHTTGQSFSAPEFAINKIESIRQHQPAVWNRVGHIATISDYLVLLLTGTLAADQATAGMTGLFDILQADWWPVALAHLALRRDLFPAPLATGAVIAPLRPHARLPLPAGIPLVAGSLDHCCAGLGAGAGGIAEGSLSLGTVSACLSLRADAASRASDCVGPGPGPDEFWALSFTNKGVSLFERYQRLHHPGQQIQSLLDAAFDAQAWRCPPAEPLVQHPEQWMRDLPPEHDPVAAMGGLLALVGMEVRRIAGRSWPAAQPASLVVAGGAAGNQRFVQHIANQLGCRLLITRNQECAARGAAMLAARAQGWPAWPEEPAAELLPAF